MRYRVDADPFLNKQPPIGFLDKLMGPVHGEKPINWNLRVPAAGEIGFAQVRLSPEFPDPEGVLDTLYEDFHEFCRCYDLAETPDGYRIRSVFSACLAHESYRITVTQQECLVESSDTEGIRRGFFFLEDEMHRREGSFLPVGTISRQALIHTRISRGYLNPHYDSLHRGELEDDTEYFSDEYLNRLAHDGVNGIWVQEHFRAILPSEIIPEYGKGGEDRLRRLNELIARCARYGIKVWLECVEPASGYDNPAFAAHPELHGENMGGYKALCPSTPQGKAYIKESTRKLFELAPGLAGIVDITVGEARSVCASAEHKALECPVCKATGMTKPELLADCEQQLFDGMREANPNAELISWVYGIRNWKKEDRVAYFQCRSGNSACMVNFEDLGRVVQLGKERLAVDYWLSYTGPGEVFQEAIEASAQRRTPVYAKLQVCSSHEVSSVPYVPVPGILYDKYQCLLEHDIRGVLYCWFFGNYPCMMNKAAGELAFTPLWESKEQFLQYLAGIYWGSDAKRAAQAYQLFAQGYSNYPVCMTFEWHGPMTDAPVWPLHLEPVDLPVSKTYKLDAMAGCDRLGETFLYHFTYEEVLQLCDTMRKKWQQGINLLMTLDAGGEYGKQEQQWVAKALGILFDSGANVLTFYHLREQLGLRRGDGTQVLEKMRQIVGEEITNSAELAELCLLDKRLGYHCEATGFKFFPEKLYWRIEELKTLLATEFPRVEERLNGGKLPLPFYFGRHEEGHRYATAPLEAARWENFRFADGSEDAMTRISIGETAEAFVLQVEILGEPSVIRINPEFRMFVPYPPVKIASGKTPALQTASSFGFFGEKLLPEQSKWQTTEQTIPGGICRTVTLVKKDFFDEEVPFRLAVTRLKTSGRAESAWEPDDRIYTRLIFGKVSPDAYVFVIPQGLQHN